MTSSLRLPVLFAGGGAVVSAVAFAAGGWGAVSLGRPGAALGAALVVGTATGWLGGRWVAGQWDAIVDVTLRIVSGASGRLAERPPPGVPEAVSGALVAMAEHMDRRIASIAEDRARVEAVLAQMVEGVMVLDGVGRVLLVNAAMERIVSSPRSEILGQGWIEAIRHHALNELVAQVLKEGRAATAEIALEDGGIQRVFSVQASPADRPDTPARDRLGTVLVFHDVTALKRLERVRADFVSNVSHELRTPLTSVAGYLEALLDGAHEDPVKRLEFLHVMKTHADRLTALVNDLLELSQIESGRYEWRRDELDAVALVRRSVALIKPAAEKKRLTLTWASDVPELLVEGDGEKLTQVLLNLLDNAIKYTGEGGTVSVDVDRRADAVAFHVRDTGVGIPDADRSRIFERFYRVDRARSRALGGTGLGLSIVKHIVEAHGGAVAVESRPGKGSTFTVTIPLVRRHAA